MKFRRGNAQLMDAKRDESRAQEKLLKYLCRSLMTTSVR